MQRRGFIKGLLLTAAGLSLPVKVASAKTFLTVKESQDILFPNQVLTKLNVTLTEEQADAIADKSDTRVRNLKMNVWKSADGGLFIADQVIGKHENIDIAVGLDAAGKVTGIEVLTYRESYGEQVMHPKWRKQFHGKDQSEHLLLDEQIKNISGATLSCRHITDGINRLTQTWDLVLKAL